MNRTLKTVELTRDKIKYRNYVCENSWITDKKTWL